MTVIDSALLPRDKRRDHGHHHRHGAIGPVDRQPIRPGGEGNNLLSTGGNVSVLVLYTPAVAARNNISLLANNVIALTSSSMAVSGVASSNYVTLADLQPLSDNLSTLGWRCTEQIQDTVLHYLWPLADLTTRRVAAQADMVFMLYTTEPSYSECGTGGRIGGIAATYNSTHPVASSTDTYALGDLTAPHEIGHVLGGHHENQIVGALPHALGYASTTCNWQTMMGGYADCEFDLDQPFPGLQPVKRLPRWSNPSLTHLGEATGTSTQNMVAALDALMPLVAAWQANPAAPGVTGSFSVGSWMCYGQYEANWSAVLGATHYQLFASISPTFSFPNLIHITGGTTALFTIEPSEPLYLRVRACNAGGCGGDSSQGNATVYYPYCL